MWRTGTERTCVYGQGEGVKTVQELLRHATSRITLDVYQQGSTEAKRLALNRVAGIFALPEK
jgi:integrase